MPTIPGDQCSFAEEPVDLTLDLQPDVIAVIHGTSNLQLDRKQLWNQEGGVDDLNADLGDLRGSSFTGDAFGYGLYDSFRFF